MISSRYEWNPNTFIPPKLLDIYTDGSKLIEGVGSDIYLDKLYLNISFRLPDNCSLFQAELIVIYRAAQLILLNNAPFTCV